MKERASRWKRIQGEMSSRRWSFTRGQWFTEQRNAVISLIVFRGFPALAILSRVPALYKQARYAHDSGALVRVEAWLVIGLIECTKVIGIANERGIPKEDVDCGRSILCTIHQE